MAGNRSLRASRCRGTAAAPCRIEVRGRPAALRGRRRPRSGGRRHTAPFRTMAADGKRRDIRPAHNRYVHNVNIRNSLPTRSGGFKGYRTLRRRRAGLDLIPAPLISVPRLPRRAGDEQGSPNRYEPTFFAMAHNACPRRPRPERPGPTGPDLRPAAVLTRLPALPASHAMRPRASPRLPAVACARRQPAPRGHQRTPRPACSRAGVSACKRTLLESACHSGGAGGSASAPHRGPGSAGVSATHAVEQASLPAGLCALLCACSPGTLSRGKPMRTLGKGQGGKGRPASRPAGRAAGGGTARSPSFARRRLPRPASRPQRPGCSRAAARC